MKKLIAIAVLFVGMTAAVFAQDGGWGSPWKFGFSAEFNSDLLYATSAKDNLKIEGTGYDTVTYEFGNINKGSVSFFPNQENLGGDQRVQVSISNSGENHDVLLNLRVDHFAHQWGKNFLQQLLFGGGGAGDSGASEYHLKGNLGIFEGYIGNDGFGGWAGRNGSWDALENTTARFGIWRPDQGFMMADDFRYYNEWGHVFGVRVKPVDNFGFALGYRLNPGWSDWNGDADQPRKSKSNINAGFIFSGRPLDGVTFDLFYAVLGGDNDTLNNNAGNGKWKNTLGAYVSLNLIENLGIGIGYTGNFNVYETPWEKTKAEYEDGLTTASRKIDAPAPYYSGIDIGVDFNGIDKIALNFSANVSFAGVNGKDVADYYTKANRRLDESIADTYRENHYDTDDTTYAWKWKDGWFHLDGQLVAKFNFIDGVPLTFAVGDQLGVTTTEDKLTMYGKTATIKTSTTTNSFKAKLGASYGVGGASLGIGLFLGVASTDSEISATDSDGRIFKITGNSTVTTFGIPITFKVSF